MPMTSYGVAIGNLIRFFRDPPDHFGRWYHGHVEISTPSGIWTSALDVDTPTGLGISYRLSGDLPPADLGAGAKPSKRLSSAAAVFDRPAQSTTFDPASCRTSSWGLFKANAVGLPRSPQPLPIMAERVLRRSLSPNRDCMSGSLQTFWRSTYRLDYRLPKAIPLHLRPWLRSDGNNALTALEAELIGNPERSICSASDSRPARACTMSIRTRETRQGLNGGTRMEFGRTAGSAYSERTARCSSGRSASTHRLQNRQCGPSRLSLAGRASLSMRVIESRQTLQYFEHTRPGRSGTVTSRSDSFVQSRLASSATLAEYLRVGQLA